MNVIEDEHHFSLVCPLYRDIRRECLYIYVPLYIIAIGLLHVNSNPFL